MFDFFSKTIFLHLKCEFYVTGCQSNFYSLVIEDMCN